MMYILTEEEYSALKEGGPAGRADRILIAEQRETIQNLCTMIANEVPLNHPSGEPNGCTLTLTHGVCDNCLVIEQCPSKLKLFSK